MVRLPIGFYLTACALSWAIWLPYIIPGLLPVWAHSPVPHYLGLAGPLVAALLWAWRTGGSVGLRRLVRSMLVPRGSALYWLLVPLLPVGLVVVMALLQPGSVGPDWRGLWRTHELPTITPVAYGLLTLGWVGLGEEAGWRGYALPRLQQRYSAITASLILTVGWALWHWPLFFYTGSGYYTMNAAGIGGWLFSLLTGSVLFTWLFNQSRGSVLACALFHGSMDVAFMADLGIPDLQTYVGAAVTMAGVLILLICGPRTLSNRGKQLSPEPRR